MNDVKLRIYAADRFSESLKICQVGEKMAETLLRAEAMIREDRKKHPVKWALLDARSWFEDMQEKIGRNVIGFFKV